jgi:predicted O-methyltransferase YrrM
LNSAASSKDGTMQIRQLAPEWLRQQIHCRRARLQTAEFRAKLARKTLAQAAAVLCDSRHEFCAGQRDDEIVPFLEWAGIGKLRRVLEIGSAKGGNLMLLSMASAPDARLVSLDLAVDPIRSAVHRGLVAPKQSFASIHGDSRSPESFLRVRRALGSKLLDLLFIDGDHSYDGVKFDFQTYSTLVRPNGVIAFHDIVLDAWQRFGRETPSDTGGVPTFWAELKQRHSDWREFVSDPDQDGFGIGAIVWNGTPDHF